jgi:N-acetylneuraminic acid mutarotase
MNSTQFSWFIFLFQASFFKYPGALMIWQTVFKSLDNPSNPAPNQIIGNFFSPTGSMLFPRSMHTANSLNDGRILVAGGSIDKVGTLASAEIYDPIAGTFSITDSMDTSRLAAASIKLQNGSILIVGGQTRGFLATNSAEIYDPLTGMFTSINPMNNSRTNPSATLLTDGKVLIIGGYEGDSETGTPLATAEIYDPKTGTFALTGSLSIGRRNHTATLLNDGTVLVAGGYNGDHLNSPEIYNPKTGIFSSGGAMSNNRRFPSASLLANGMVILAGGFDNGDIPSGTMNSADLYLPTKNQFAPTGAMHTARGRHTATNLNNNEILITGGYNGITVFQSAEIYNISTAKFSAIGSMNQARWRHTETLLTNGNVLIIGGENAGNVLSSAEIFIASK